MNKFLERSSKCAGRSFNAAGRSNSDALVLEDSTDVTETTAGDGKAKVFQTAKGKLIPSRWNETGKQKDVAHKISRSKNPMIAGDMKDSDVELSEDEEHFHLKDNTGKFKALNSGFRELFQNGDSTKFSSSKYETNTNFSHFLPSIKLENSEVSASAHLKHQEKESSSRVDSLSSKLPTLKSSTPSTEKPKLSLRMKLEQIKKGISIGAESSESCKTTSSLAAAEKKSDDCEEGHCANEELKSATDGIPNSEELESATDGIPNSEELESTTDGIPNSEELESATDGIPNSTSLGEDFIKLKMPKTIPNYRPVPLEVEIAKDLKRLVLGSPFFVFADEWKFQGFAFSESLKVPYGLIQKKSGPCGIFSVIQAFVLRQLLFEENTNSSSKRLQPNSMEKFTALAAALANIFWQAGQQERAVVAVLGRESLLNANDFQADGVTEKVLVVTITKYEDLLNYLTQNIEQFCSSSGPGVILSLYSAVLSRTVNRISKDMDDPNRKLIDDHGLCSQELLNLFLSGRAVTNFFNNDLEVFDSDNGQRIKRGIHVRTEIGFLSTIECCKASLSEVGAFLKTPKNPIWILHMESTYCILFSTRTNILSDWRAEKKFELYYYCTLGKQDKEIRLMIDNSDPAFRPPPNEDVDSPVELCVRTKWSQADIHWIGVKPLDL